MNDLLTELAERVRTGRSKVSAHSKTIRAGDIFVALPPAVSGAREKRLPGGEAYAMQAAGQGAAFIVCESFQKDRIDASALPDECRLAEVVNAREALGILAAAQCNTDRKCPQIVGITGTNGKTTESYILEHVFQSKGYAVGVIGTVAYTYRGRSVEAPLTTPGCLDLHGLLQEMASCGTDYVFMEVSSHALDQQRSAGITFSAALLTNISQDHLDYHPDMEDYFQVKSRLFLPCQAGGALCESGRASVNMDDPYGLRLLRQYPEMIGYGFSLRPELPNRQLVGAVESMSPEGMALSLAFDRERWHIQSPLVGAFNAYNLLGAQAVALSFGFSPGDFQCLRHFTGVPGRLERVPNALRLNVFVDYAHTPDALGKVITTLREVGFKRIITVFGCGGNRDASKRPLMGGVVSALSDLAVVTSDNPRFENPEAIIADILPGMKGQARIIVESDRRKAIELAVKQAGEGDALLVAGKGHETYQIIQGIKHPFSDVQVLRELTCG